MTTQPDSYEMRAPCRYCHELAGRIVGRSGQDCVYCLRCDRWQYNAPRTETGRKQRTVRTVHDDIKPSVRFKVLQRARGHCEMPGCGATGDLHIAHLLSVKDGFEAGIPEAQLNGPANLCALCPECNLGQGVAPMDPLIYMALMRKWLAA